MKILNIIAKALGKMAGRTFVALILAWPLLAVWNCSVSQLLSLKAASYWQMFWLYEFFQLLCWTISKFGDNDDEDQNFVEFQGKKYLIGK